MLLALLIIKPYIFMNLVNTAMWRFSDLFTVCILTRFSVMLQVWDEGA